ncbi:glycosyltransferase [candidate division KSB1 bacterium]|nr:glycosyltransferase [candidate division KSB1 bacterium]
MKKKILWAANSYWNSPFQVGANNLANEFLQDGWSILFLSDPISPFHVLRSGSKSDFFDRFTTWRSGGEIDSDGQLIYYSPFTLFPPYDKPLLRSTTVLENWHRWTLPNVVDKVADLGFLKVDMLVIDSVSQHFWIDVVESHKTIFRITDNFAAFDKVSYAALAKERELIARADHVIYTSKGLEQHIIESGAKNWTYMPNGVNLKKMQQEDNIVPAEYENIPEPRVIYVGAIEKWFDLELMRFIATRLPDVSFVIIGPPRISLKAIDDLDNIYILGKRDSSEIGRYMRNAKVGIIPFDASNPVVDSIHPLKLYEYLACGLSVVSSDWRELAEIDAPFHRVENKQEFFVALKHALQEPRPIVDLEKFSWHTRYQQIVEIFHGETSREHIAIEHA